MGEANQPTLRSVEGDFIVAVGNAVGTEIPPSEGAGVAADAERAFRVTLVAPNLAHTVETVDLSAADVNAAKRTLYMIQRGCSISERQSMPASHDDTYDVICYIDDWLRRDDSSVMREAFEERRSDDRYETTPPEWVQGALNAE